MKAVAAAGCLLFGGLVLAGGPRRRPNQFLALFLFLIAGNQAVETARVLDHGMPLFRWATAFAVLDPLALYAFAATYPRRNRLARPARWVPLAVVAAGLLVWALWVPTSDLADTPFLVGELCLAAYTLTAYAAVWRRSLWHALRREGLPGARLLYPALCCAAFPVADRVASDLAVLFGVIGDLNAVVRLTLWIPLLGPFLVVAIREARGSPRARFVALWTAIGVLLTVTLTLDVWYALLRLWVSVPFLLFGNVGRGAAAVRWLLFGVFVSVAALRDDLLGMSLGRRRLAARLLVTFAFMVVALLAVAAFGGSLGQRSPLTPFDLVLLAAVLLLSQGFRSLVGRLAASLYGVPDRSDPAAAADAYRSAVGQALERGLGIDAAPLGRLRRELGLDERVAAGIARTAADALGGPLAAGQVLGERFRVLRFLGRGGAGRAFLAHDDLLQRTVVLKEVLCDRPDDEAAVLREARLAAGLQHPNVVTLHDVLRRPGSALIVSEHVAGGSLQARLAAGPLPQEAALRIAEGVLAGLAAIHARGIVHRDLTPGNVLLQPDDVPKISDFGIARARHGVTVQLDEPEAFQGTLEWMSPEQMRGEVAGPASDLFQAGLLLRRLFAPSPPPAVAAIVERALQPTPEARWPDADTMAAALREAASDLPVKPADPRVKPGKRARSGPRR